MAVQKEPGKDAGQISVQTIKLRGPMPLTAAQRRRARFLRFEVGWDWPDIAADVGRSQQEVRHSLANARTLSPDPKRATVNVGPAAIERLRVLQRPGEAMWETMNRLLGI